MSYKVSAKRHLAKTISYRVVSTGIGFAIMWWATGDIRFGTVFGFMELVFKPFLYYAHERTWYKWIKIGLIEDKKTKVKKVQLDEVQPETIIKEPVQTPPTTGKKVLNYSSNR